MRLLFIFAALIIAVNAGFFDFLTGKGETVSFTVRVNKRLLSEYEDSYVSENRKSSLYYIQYLPLYYVQFPDNF